MAQQPLSAQPAGSGESASVQPHVPQWHSFVAQKSVQHGSAEAVATAARRAQVFIIGVAGHRARLEFYSAH